ncbi:MAG: hypothetical protein ACHP9Z_12200 [Streptosporangiales bacterium]
MTAAMGAVRALAAQLAGLGIEKVTLESASDYWAAAGGTASLPQQRYLNARAARLAGG